MSDVRTVLVTGAAGFVGRHLCPLLASRGWRVRAALRAASPDVLPGVAEHAVVGDLRATTDWSSAFVGVDAVVHLAALAHHTDPRRQPGEDDFFAVNAHATRRLAAAARAAGTVRRFVNVSSIGAVTDASETTVDERTPPAPATPYGRSKLAGETAVAETLRGGATQFVSLRPMLIYGPGNPGNMARLLRIVGTGVPLPLGALRNRRSFVFVGNFTAAIAAALAAPALDGGSYPVADGEIVSTPELLRLLGVAAGRKARVWPCPRWLLRGAARGADALAALGLRTGLDTYSLRKLEQSLAVSSEAFARLTGWRPEVSLADGLRQTLRPERGEGGERR